MLNYEHIKQFADILKKDQAPELSEEFGVEMTPYELGTHIFSVHFVVDYHGDISVKVHVQWQLLARMVLTSPVGTKLKRDCVKWHATDAESVHIDFRPDEEPGVTYTAVMFKNDLHQAWDTLPLETTPFPESESCEDIWVKLFNRGVWDM